MSQDESIYGKREGEIALAADPAEAAGDGRLVFIGRIRSPWKSRAECPKNMRAARDAGRQATLEILPPYRPGLLGLSDGSPVIVLSWLGQAPRNLIVQKPRHAAHAKGVFALRSPARPNPIGLHVTRIATIDHEGGAITLDAIDVLDGTPLLDLKPYFASADSIGDAAGLGE